VTLAPVGYIAGIGGAVPAGVVTNFDLEQTLDTTNAWIVERTGIRERHIANPAETLVSYTTRAAEQALARAGVAATDLDGIIFATVTPDHRLPSTACNLQAAIGAHRAWAFDVVAACPGWLFGLTVADGLMRAGQGDIILVVGAEKLSTVLDWSDRSTAILFGDGAGAAVVRRTVDSQRGILASYLGADGRLAPLLHIPGGGAADPISQEMLHAKRHFVQMAGREIFKAAVLAMSRSTDEAISRAGLLPQDIDLLVPHQANLRIIEATAKHAGIGMDKVMVNLDRFGNTSSASIPLALDEAVASGRLRPGMIVMLVSFGAGLTWASVVMRW
jgi:3-oxoacyl-[acyl-carrier-protein] synthase-3